jgi:hypothetical protein
VPLRVPGTDARHLPLTEQAKYRCNSQAGTTSGVHGKRWYPCTTAGGIRRPGAPWKSRCFLLRLHARNPVQKPKLNDAPFLSSFVHSCWSEPKSRAPREFLCGHCREAVAAAGAPCLLGTSGCVAVPEPGKVSLPRIRDPRFAAVILLNPGHEIGEGHETVVVEIPWRRRFGARPSGQNPPFICGPIAVSRAAGSCLVGVWELSAAAGAGNPAGPDFRSLFPLLTLAVLRCRVMVSRT